MTVKVPNIQIDMKGKMGKNFAGNWYGGKGT